jgi:hypothetical protein
MHENLTNVEMAHKLHEKAGERRDIGPWKGHDPRLEIVEVLLLAIVAVATAWSGYQAARWDGRSAESFAEATVLIVESDEEAILGGQEQLRDASSLNTWLLARAAGDAAMMKLVERRFSEDYRPAFEAWLLTDPFTNPDAPPDPAEMPEYANRLTDEGARTRQQMATVLDDGRASREVAEDYVRLTVFLATVLFLTAMSQRFTVWSAQVVLLGIAVAATTVILGLLMSYPRG